MKKHILSFTLLISSCSTIFAQSPDDLLSMVDKPKKEYTTATFKTTRLINFHTVEVLSRRSLDFRISHRFGDFNSGAYNAWGVDGGANIRLGLEYCHGSRLMFGIGRTSGKKIADGFLKYRLLKQTTKGGGMPVSVTLFTSVYHTFMQNVIIDGYNKYQTIPDRLSYCHQIMVARKFNSRFSLQLTGAMVHVNLVDKISDKNDCFVVGAVTRFKFAKRQAITLEYGYRLNKYSKEKYYDSFGIGYDLETGGHVFQVHLTNSFGLTEDQYFMYTNTSWQNWGIRLGFNISRVFTLQGKNKAE
ncbi:MAG TPA: DUF5777 family beta-barrel protein [Bacteroidia bacterium]|nr:DUF5777 family beta-barrel protein [Bacteroidia bacterium]